MYICKQRLFYDTKVLKLKESRGIVKSSGFFVAMRAGQPWEQPRPGVISGREARRGGQAGRQGGRASAPPAFGGFGTPCMRFPRGFAATYAHFGRACRPSLSGGACRPSPLPPCLRGVIPYRSLGGMPGRGCSHGCAWLGYLRSFPVLPANTRFSAVCDNF